MAEAVIQGIDVSHYQNVIEWKKVAAAGNAFAFIKATDGSSTIDSMFQVNWNRAREAGLRRGAYHFFRPVTDALQQARHFLQHLGDDLGELPPVLDFELLNGATREAALQSAKDWMDAVEHVCGRKPILYTFPAFWRSALKNPREFAGYPLWIAHYTSAPQPVVPEAWNHWSFWQHSEKGSVPGIVGPVDLNRFHGNLMELDALCARIQPESATAGS